MIFMHQTFHEHGRPILVSKFFYPAIFTARQNLPAEPEDFRKRQYGPGF
jgi:hypothetical protein